MSENPKKIGVKDWYRFKHLFADRKEKYLSKGNYKCLILGTFPSEESKKRGFFYGNKSNAFWEFLGGVFDVDLKDKDLKVKEDWLDMRGIALYDIVESYEGLDWYSNDGALFGYGKGHKYSVDFVYEFMQKNQNARIMVTSKKVEDKFKQEFSKKISSVDLLYLPSPSGSNRSMTGDEKRARWKKEFENAGLLKQ